MSYDDLSLEQFYSALELVPHKPAYDKAKATCAPVILELEANPQYFLARDAGNPWAAAHRYAAYWELRVELFGDRVFQPLLGSNDDDSSALNDEDLAVLERGEGSILPTDRSGRTVLFFDYYRLSPELFHATEKRLRCFFYLFHKALDENRHANAHQVVILCTMCKPPPNVGYDYNFVHRFMRLPDSMPIVFDAIHLLAVQPSVTGRGWMLQYVMQCAIKMLGSYYSSRMKAHFGSAIDSLDIDDENYFAASLLYELKMEGFVESSLPDCAGGNFTLASFTQWLQRQRMRERRRYEAQEDRQRRRRQINNYHSRQKRERQRRELADLQATVDGLKLAHQEAMATNTFLTGLLEEARTIVDQVESGHYQVEQLGALLPWHGWKMESGSPMLHRGPFDRAQPAIDPLDESLAAVATFPFDGLYPVLNDDDDDLFRLSLSVASVADDDEPFSLEP